MKRKTLISAVALVAVLGGTFGAYAAGYGSQGWGPQERGMRGQMQQMGGMSPFGPNFDFATVDADEDGKITQDEIDAFRAARFAEVDANGDGTVDADELFAHQEAQRVARMQARAASMIENRDGDGDGLLSAEEMQGPRAGTMFSRLDRDGDGAVSQEELSLMTRQGMGRMEDRMQQGQKFARMGGHHGQYHGQMMQRGLNDGCMMMPGQMRGQMQGQGMGQGMGQGIGYGPMYGQQAPAQQAPASDGN
ncbi:calcium-binding protein [Celeribacter sp. HF31]|uniref:EF-hand domain-containing protein n=1 Tax=Celeribacter sp. HF31 TaxID=2721558 RepID=UPI00142FEFC0|nr:EF-hand domain-containing protein [Celeribacter sp. HF31]NIY78201.1 calcium-binding protein [Celeribacter sp. HF31]